MDKISTSSSLTTATIKQAVSDWCEGGSKRDATESTYGSIADWDTSQVTSMSQLLQYKMTCDPDIGNWNTAKVTDMSRIFYGAERFNQAIGKWNTAKVNKML